MQNLPQTPSQTVGPYFAYGLTAEQYRYDFNQIAGSDMAPEDAGGEHINILGRVLDGQGVPIPDAMIELWQPDRKAFGRCGTGTDPQHRFEFRTVRPQSADGQAPHLVVIVFMRGLLSHAYTRLYLSDEAAANAADEVLNTVPAERRATLVAQRREARGRIEYHFDIRMQGSEETVFFDL